MFNMSLAEEQELDQQLEPKLEWARRHTIETEQFVQDATRLLSSTSDRMESIKKQVFFSRCWKMLSGETKSLENAHVNDLIQAQKMAFRFIHLLQENDLMTAHSLLTLRNNLLTLQLKEKETRVMLSDLAKRTLERFQQLENRVEELEINQALHGWGLILSELDYVDKYPGRNMRLLRIINDFYNIKSSGWSYWDYLFLSRSLKTVDIEPKVEISMGSFIDSLVEEIYSSEHGFEQFSNLVLETAAKPTIERYSESIISNISSQSFCIIHSCHFRYVYDYSTIDTLSSHLNIDAPSAMKMLLKRFIGELNVNPDTKVTLRDMAFEILGCMWIARHLLAGVSETGNSSVHDNETESTGPESNSSSSDTSNSGSKKGNIFKTILSNIPNIKGSR